MDAALDVEQDLITVGDGPRGGVEISTNVTLKEEHTPIGSQAPFLVPVFYQHLVRHGLGSTVFPARGALAKEAVEVERVFQTHREGHAGNGRACCRQFHAPWQLAHAQGNPPSKLGGRLRAVVRCGEDDGGGVSNSRNAVVYRAEGAAHQNCRQRAGAALKQAPLADLAHPRDLQRRGVRQGDTFSNVLDIV
jgi:hypothetical protein